eukprot:11993436-Alexandrium_andersonii.AAC.1
MLERSMREFRPCFEAPFGGGAPSRWLRPGQSRTADPAAGAASERQALQAGASRGADEAPDRADGEAGDADGGRVSSHDLSLGLASLFGSGACL